MKLPDNVRIKKFPWTILPILSTYTAHAIYPNIYLPNEVYRDLQSDNPNIKNIAILLHEQTHIERQRKNGWLLWELQYCLDGKFRFEEEIKAITKAMRIYKQYNLKWDIDKSAKALSSYLYLWCISYQKAKARLKHEWITISKL